MINVYLDTVECPYCEYENDMTEGTVDLPDDNKFDHECENCEREFEVHVEFNPSYSSGKIEYVNCEKCGNETREPAKRGKIFPFPQSLDENVVCKHCFYKGHNEDFENE
ncbi:hypothetical protein GCM10008986_16520 [Salinibacillus aidingensis]|uniref:Uncharacterized protein n=1 Tax=Salinibacillus aidingensis TaxID=237684 RepID=A0ABP3L3G1_9BACI